MSNTPLSHDHHHPCHYDDIGEDDNERNTSAFSVECWLYSRTPPSTPRLHFDPCITRLLHCIKLHCIALDCITLDWSWWLLPGADTWSVRFDMSAVWSDLPQAHPLTRSHDYLSKWCLIHDLHPTYFYWFLFERLWDNCFGLNLIVVLIWNIWFIWF